ncbi:MAG: efflux RND transporter periplasmic adaptor subunit [Planctomycetes bacterium]|nr:efflux RND transporter periplasmic adaptor subunit [Planctomycetota bacterium]
MDPLWDLPLKRVLALLLLLAAAGAAAKFYLLTSTPLTVKTAAVSEGAVEETVTSTSAGTVKAAREVKIYAELPGRIDRILHREGHVVKSGELVVELRRRGLEAQLSVADANLTVARSQFESARLRQKKAQDDYRRVEALYNSKADDRYVSGSEFERAASERDLAEEAVRAAQSSLVQLEAQRQVVLADLDKTRILSPFEGVLTRLNVEEGGSASVTSPLFEVMDFSTLHVLAPFDEVDIGRIRVGQPVRVSFDAFSGRPVDSRVLEILPVVNTAQVKNRTVDVKVSLEDGRRRFLVGMSADVTIVTGRKEKTLSVPTKSIKNGQYVFVLEERKIRRRKIVPGLSNWDTTEVCEGLRAGERVVSLLDLDVSGDLEGREAIGEP